MGAVPIGGLSGVRGLWSFELEELIDVCIRELFELV